MSKRQGSTIIPGGADGHPTVVEPSPKKPKKNAEENKGSSTNYPIPRITTLFATDKKPIGWIFAGFYNGRSYLKLLTNKNDSTTIIGTTKFRPFTNLKTKWVPESLLGENLWASKIDISDEEGSFPRELEGVAVAWANKIARSLLSTNVFSNIELKQQTVGEPAVLAVIPCKHTYIYEN